ncbi:isopeptide-forming domain-containing fimbrial protein [uncultured Senegalimassilia sp.]|uniref:isopeptide-forming domain-containing fimbrial protein n=1 Tax=uncultured Senegalimassilia sp. TaxID=1714350 RepID=UPI0025E4EF02|nr:isopeptide-forming domain-containing fimbrial protein [uncultured Senegalimassilia sp.]
MKAQNKIARLALTAGLTATMAFGNVAAPAAMAFADTGSTVTFADADYATSTTYKGIQIFKATVTTTGEATTVSSIEWASEAAKAAVVAAIKERNASYSSEIAQDAADWLSANAGVTGTESKVASDNVLSAIAGKLNTSGAWQTTTGGSASLSGLEAGYWLFLTAAAGTPDGMSTDAFTSPVYAVVDGSSSTTVTPKKSVPTVEKKILDDADAAGADLKTSDKWKDVADSQVGQEVNYRLTGTIAGNYATFSAYAYKFTDELSSGLDYVDGSVEVYALNGGTYAKIDTDHYSVVNAGNTLTVEFKVGNGDKGLKDVAGVDADTQIVVFYKAQLNSRAVIGNAADGNKGGNPNTVKLTYSNNPYTEGTGETIEDTVADFAFKLNLNKVDQGTEQGLAGAVFTIQSADANTRDQYIASKADAAEGVVAGQLVTVADANNLPEYVKFTSDSDGKIAVSGLDAGSYTVTEVQTPDGTKYAKADPFTFTIAPTYDESAMKVTGLTAAVSESDKGRSDIAFGTLDGNAGDNKLTGVDGTGTDAAKGEVTINVGNTKSVGLPITGIDGVTLTWIAGGVVLVIGVARLIRRRRAESEE